MRVNCQLFLLRVNRKLLYDLLAYALCRERVQLLANHTIVSRGWYVTDSIDHRFVLIHTQHTRCLLESYSRKKISTAWSFAPSVTLGRML